MRSIQISSSLFKSFSVLVLLSQRLSRRLRCMLGLHKSSPTRRRLCDSTCSVSFVTSWTAAKLTPRPRRTRLALDASFALYLTTFRLWRIGTRQCWCVTWRRSSSGATPMAKSAAIPWAWRLWASVTSPAAAPTQVLVRDLARGLEGTRATRPQVRIPIYRCLPRPHMRTLVIGLRYHRQRISKLRPPRSDPLSPSPTSGTPRCIVRAAEMGCQAERAFRGVPAATRQLPSGRRAPRAGSRGRRPISADRVSLLPPRRRLPSPSYGVTAPRATRKTTGGQAASPAKAAAVRQVGAAVAAAPFRP